MASTRGRQKRKPLWRCWMMPATPAPTARRMSAPRSIGSSSRRPSKTPACSGSLGGCYGMAPCHYLPQSAAFKPEGSTMDIDTFLAAYIECALWSTSDNSSDDVYGPRPLDANYGPEDIAPDTLAAM